MISSLEAERIVCGCLLIDSRLIDDVYRKLDSSDFTDNNCLAIYLTVTALAEEHAIKDITLIEILEWLVNNYKQDRTYWMHYLMTLMDCVPSTVNYDQYIHAIKKASFNRKLKNVLQDGINNLDHNNSASEVCDIVASNLEEISKHNIEELPFKTVGEIAEQVINNTEEAYKKGDKILGLDTGYEALNETINGLQKSNLIILAARPAVGKSALALNIANNIAKKGKHVAYFSLEMSSEQLVQRLIANYSSVSLTKIQNGLLKEEDWKFLMQSLEKIKTLPIHIDQTMAYSVSDIRQRCLQLKAQNQLDCIVIDYLQLITAEHMGNRVDEVGYISRELKKLAQTLEVPVLALSQLSRSVEQRQDKTPLLSDLRESGSIEQDADIVMFLHRNNNAGVFVTEGLPVSLTIAKNRQGKLGTCEFIFIGKNSRFVERRV